MDSDVQEVTLPSGGGDDNEFDVVAPENLTPPQPSPGEAPALVCKFEEPGIHPRIGGYGRIQAKVYKSRAPDYALVGYVGERPVCAMRVFNLEFPGPKYHRRVAGVSMEERKAPAIVVGIGALGTIDGEEHKGYMTELIGFMVEHCKSQGSAALVALTRHPEGKIWVNNDFVTLKNAPSVARNTMVAKVFDPKAFSVEAKWEAPFHF